jgi:hypothetical protein
MALDGIHIGNQHARYLSVLESMPNDCTKLMMKGAAYVNGTCCLDVEEEDEGCVIVIQCDGMNNTSDVWWTTDAS